DLLMAAAKALLYRYTGQGDILIGTPIAARNRAETEDLIGLFTNVLVLRTEVSGGLSFEECLARCQETAVSAFAHQDIPFELLVEELNPERELSYNPIFQVLFVLQSAPAEELKLPEVTLQRFVVDAETTKFDLTLNFIETEQELKGTFEYNTDLFEMETIERMCRHYLNLLEGILIHPQSRVIELPLMSEAEKRELIWEMNETAAEYDREVCIHEVIEGRAQAKPDATAVVWKDQRISYGELEGRCNQVTNYLRREGVGPEVRVGLMMERSIELVVWMIGILKAGGAYVPIDPAYPKSRRELIVEDSRVELMVSDQGAGELAGETKVILTEEVREAVRQESVERVESGVRSSNLGYVIYTSGSTGRPKGVGLAHRGVIGLMKWAERTYSREEMDGVLATTSICFDLSVYEILVVLGLGGKVVVGRSGVEVREEIAGGEIVQMNTVPSLMEGVLREGELNESIKVVNLAGEALSRGLVEQVYEGSKVERVVNLYGPSEDTTYTTIEEEARGSEERVTIGRGIENTRIYIADERGELVPRGARGEIYIGS